MKQSINLCVGLPKKITVPLSSKRIMKVSGIFASFLLVVYGFAYWGELKLKGEIKALQVKQSKIQASLTAITSKYPTILKKGEQIDKMVTALNEEAMVKTRIVSELSQQSASNTQGFSRYLEVLSKEIVPNVWLEKIELTEGGTQVTLTGRAFHTEAVLQFMKNLSGNAIFADKQLKLSNLTQAPTKSAEGTKETKETKEKVLVTQEPMQFILQTKIEKTP